MPTLSLLSRSVGESFLQTARQNLEKHGSLVSMLFITFASGKRIEIPLRLPATTEDKEAYFVSIGLAMASLNEVIAEAILLSEGWVVNARQAPASHKLPLSQHPSRQEAITLIGRNAAGTRHTCAVQPFQRQASGQFIWNALSIALYDEPVAHGGRAVGLLDYLFSGKNSDKRPDQR